MVDESKERKCPDCSNILPVEAIKCEHCQAMIHNNDSTNENDELNNKEGQVLPQKTNKLFNTSKKQIILTVFFITMLIVAVSAISVTVYHYVYLGKSSEPFNEIDDIVVDHNDMEEELEEEKSEEQVEVEEVNEVYEENASDQETIISETYYVEVNYDSFLFLRKTPGTEDKPTDDIIEGLPRNRDITVTNKHDNAIEKDGYIWWEVNDPYTAKSGWVASELLSKEELKEEIKPEKPQHQTSESLIRGNLDVICNDKEFKEIVKRMVPFIKNSINDFLSDETLEVNQKQNINKDGLIVIDDFYQMNLYIPLKKDSLIVMGDDYDFAMYLEYNGRLVYFLWHSIESGRFKGFDEYEETQGFSHSVMQKMDMFFNSLKITYINKNNDTLTFLCHSNGGDITLAYNNNTISGRNCYIMENDIRNFFDNPYN